MPYEVNKKIYISWSKAFDAWMNGGDDSELEFLTVTRLTKRAVDRLWRRLAQVVSKIKLWFAELSRKFGGN